MEANGSFQPPECSLSDPSSHTMWPPGAKATNALACPEVYGSRPLPCHGPNVPNGPNGPKPGYLARQTKTEVVGTAEPWH